MRFRARTAVALAAFALVAAACGGEPAATIDAVGSAAPPSGGGSTQTQTGTPSPAAIPEILEFEAPLLGGGTLRGVDYAGKDVAFWFWAPW